MLLEWSKTSRGYVVLKRHKGGIGGDEFVTGFVNPSNVKENDISSLGRVEHLWGHYFTNEVEARSDYLSRVERGY